MMMFTPQQENAVDGAAKKDRPVMTGVDVVKTATVVSHTPSLSQPKGNDPPELLTNEIIVDKGNKPACPGGSIYSTEKHAMTIIFMYMYVGMYCTYCTSNACCVSLHNFM